MVRDFFGDFEFRPFAAAGRRWTVEDGFETDETNRALIIMGPVPGTPALPCPAGDASVRHAADNPLARGIISHPEKHCCRQLRGGARRRRPVNAGNPPHRHGARATAHQPSPYRCLVALATASRDNRACVTFRLQTRLT